MHFKLILILILSFKLHFFYTQNTDWYRILENRRLVTVKKYSCIEVKSYNLFQNEKNLKEKIILKFNSFNFLSEMLVYDKNSFVVRIKYKYNKHHDLTATLKENLITQNRSLTTKKYKYLNDQIQIVETILKKRKTKLKYNYDSQLNLFQILYIEKKDTIIEEEMRYDSNNNIVKKIIFDVKDYSKMYFEYQYDNSLLRSKIEIGIDSLNNQDTLGIVKIQYDDKKRIVKKFLYSKNDGVCEEIIQYIKKENLEIKIIKFYRKDLTGNLILRNQEYSRYNRGLLTHVERYDENLKLKYLTTFKWVK